MASDDALLHKGDIIIAMMPPMMMMVMLFCARRRASIPHRGARAGGRMHAVGGGGEVEPIFEKHRVALLFGNNSRLKSRLKHP